MSKKIENTKKSFSNSILSEKQGNIMMMIQPKGKGMIKNLTKIIEA